MSSGTTHLRSWVVGTAAAALFGAMALTNTPAEATGNVSDLFELDGNPTASSTVTGDDWSTLVGSSAVGTAPGFVAKTSMPIADSDSPTDTSYYTGGGSKDVRDVSDWQHSPGDVAPDKDEILNAFAAAYKTGAATDTNRDLILFFGADRFANSGDSQMGFWFFRSEVSLNSNGTFNGVHTAKAAASGTTPAHGGDILVLSDFSGGGRVSTINVYEWVGGKNPLTHIDSGSGSVDCEDSTHNTNVCAIENSTNNVDTAWSYTPKAGTANKYPTGSFLEGGINVSQLVSGGDECFASFLAETRSSTSTTAQLKDFALGRFPICAPTTSLTASPTAANPVVVLKGGSATLSFSEENDGDLPLTSPSVTTDNTSCTPSYVSGNTDADDPAVLDPDETFLYQCTLTNIQSDVTVVATGHGTDFRNKDVTYCTTATATQVCDTDERASAGVDVIAPSTTLSSTAAAANPLTIHANESSVLSFYETNDGTGGTAAQLGLTPASISTDNADCSPTYVSGDTANANVLDVGETWLFQCTITPTSAGTVTVVATGHGTLMGHDVTYCATAGLTATQVCDPDERTSVSVTVINPSTSLTKTASAFVTYTYTETNDAGDGGYLSPPTAGSRDSFVTDDNCTGVSYQSGDTAHAGYLDDGETWTFTCTKTIAGPTAAAGVTNVATGHGIDATGSDVTYCTTATAGKFCDTDERDSVTVIINHN